MKRWFCREKRFNRRDGGLVCTWSMRQGRVSQVTLRTSTSILLLSVLVAGILSPSGLCALMCERHLRAERQRPCGHASDSMSGMMHHHSAAINHPDFDMAKGRCLSVCGAVKLLNLSRKAAARVRARQAGILEPDRTNQVMTPGIATAFGSYGGSPPRCKAVPALSILRI
jgi:hypothetical protein